MTNSSHQQPVSSTTVRLLPANARNEQFDLNIKCFEHYFPDIHKKVINYQARHYQICLNPDDSINIYDTKTKSTLYPASQHEIDQHFAIIDKTLQFHIGMNTAFLGKTKESQKKIKNAPFHPQLHQQLFKQSHLPPLFDENAQQITVHKDNINFLPLLRVYGIGLGTHISHVIQQYDIACLIIHEPEFELFFNSLYTLAWHQIVPKFVDDPHRSLFISCEPQVQALQKEAEFLKQNHPFYYFSKASLFGSLVRDFKNLKDEHKNLDVSRYSQQATGWYDDQAMGLKHAIENIKAQSMFFHGGATQKKYRVFVVGSGPSLNESMSYLKQNKNNALIIACGSAISILIKNDIQPHIHVVQERPTNKEFLLHYSDEKIYNKMVCIKLNVVSSDIDELYKKVFVLQKANEPGSSLLPTNDYPHSCHVNPTVTNTGIKICTLIGANEVFLFGVDYGSSEDHSTIRAQGTYLFKSDDIDKKLFRVIKGNFGKKVYAHEYFAWSVEVAEAAILASKKQNIRWINVGDGAEIKQTIATKPENLPSTLTKNFELSKVLQQIESLFDCQYSIDSITQEIVSTHIPASQDFLIAMLDCFDSLPQSRCGIMTNLSLITQAASVGSDEDSYLPKKLFGVEFISFLDILYVQISTTQSDEQAITLYKNAIPVLQQHIESIFQHFLTLVAEIEK